MKTFIRMLEIAKLMTNDTAMEVEGEVLLVEDAEPGQRTDP